MPDFSKFRAGGVDYTIKDAEARSRIASLESYSEYLGVTTTALTDGATTNPVTINGTSVTAKKGEIVNYGSKEFIFNGTVWQEFGDMSALKALAFKDNASATYTPAGSVSFSNTNKTATVSAASSGTTTYTPAGSVSLTAATVKEVDSVGTLPSATMPTVTYESGTETLVFNAGTFSSGTLPTTNNKSVASSTGASFAGTAVRLVTGNISVPNTATFTGTQATITVS